MDETTLTLTLRDLAANPPLHTAPAADARHRARRLQRRRRTGAGALVLVAVAGTAVAVHPWARSSGSGTTAGGGDAALTKLLNDPKNPNRASTDYALVQLGTGEIALYWQHDHLCLQTWHSAASSSRSECSKFVGDVARPLTVADIGTDEGVMVLAIGKNVTRVRIGRPDGSQTDVTPVTANGFPQGAAVVTGKVAGATAFNADGAQLGARVVEPDAPRLTIQQVTEQAPCDPSLPAPAGELKDRSGKDCYQLSAEALPIHPKSVEARYDDTQGYLIEVDLNEADRAAFGELTAKVTTLAEPLNQLAIVFNGVVLSAPTIQTAIDGGMFEITAGPTGFTKAEVDALAVQLRG